MTREEVNGQSKKRAELHPDERKAWEHWREIADVRKEAFVFPSLRWSEAGDQGGIRTQSCPTPGHR